MQQQTSDGSTPNVSDVSWLCQIATAHVILEWHNQLPASLAMFQVFLGLWNCLCLGLAKRRWWPPVWDSVKADLPVLAPVCCGIQQPGFASNTLQLLWEVAVTMQAPKKAS